MVEALDENVILWPPLIAKTFERIGRPATEAQVLEDLRRLADGQRDAIESALVEARLRDRHEYTKSGDTALDRQRHHLKEVRRVAEAKLSELDTVSAEVRAELDAVWPERFLHLVDGKRLLREYVEHTGFRSLRDFLAALVQCADEHPDLLPPDIKRLRDVLRAAVV